MQSLRPTVMTVLLLSALLLPTAASARPCGIDPNCTPPPEPKVYATGTIYTPNWQAVMWVDGERTALPPLTNAYNVGTRAANSIFVAPNLQTGVDDVYVAGTAHFAVGSLGATESSAMVWKNGQILSQTPSLLTTYLNRYAGANSVFVEGGNVHVAGFTDRKTTGQGVAPTFADMKPIMWKNGVASLPPLDPTGLRGEVKAIYVRNGVTYAVGNHNFTMENNPSTPYGNAEIWVNGVRVPGNNGPLLEANAVFATGTTLHVAGTLGPLLGVTTKSTASYVYRPTSWGAATNAQGSMTMFKTVVLPSNNNQSTVTGMFVVGSRVYSVGWELKPTGRYVAKLWINSQPVDLSLESENAMATSVHVHGFDVYVGGSIHNVGSQYPRAVIWKNGELMDLNGDALGSHITSIFVK